MNPFARGKSSERLVDPAAHVTAVHDELKDVTKVHHEVPAEPGEAVPAPGPEQADGGLTEMQDAHEDVEPEAAGIERSSFDERLEELAALERREREALHAENERARAEREQLEQQLHELLVAQELAVGELSDARTAIDETRAAVDTARQEIDRLNACLVESEQRTVAAREDVEAGLRDKLELQQHLESTRADVATRVAQLEAANAAAAQAADQARAEIERLNVASEHSAAEARGEIERLHAVVAEREEQLAAEAPVRAGLENSRAELSAALEATRQQLSQAHVEIERRLGQVAEQEAALATARTENGNLQQRLEQMSAAEQGARAAVVEAHAQLRESSTAAREEIERHTAQLAESESRIAALHEEIAERRTSAAASDERAAELTDNLGAAQSSLDEARTELVQVRAEADQAAEAAAQATEATGEAQSRVARLEGTVGQLRAELGTSHEQVADLELRLAQSSQSEVDARTAQVEAERLVDRVRAESETVFASARTEAAAEIERKQGELAATERELERAREEIGVERELRVEHARHLERVRAAVTSKEAELVESGRRLADVLRSKLDEIVAAEHRFAVTESQHEQYIGERKQDLVEIERRIAEAREILTAVQAAGERERLQRAALEERLKALWKVTDDELDVSPLEADEDAPAAEESEAVEADDTAMTEPEPPDKAPEARPVLEERPPADAVGEVPLAQQPTVERDAVEVVAAAVENEVDPIAYGVQPQVDTPAAEDAHDDTTRVRSRWTFRRKGQRWIDQPGKCSVCATRLQVESEGQLALTGWIFVDEHGLCTSCQEAGWDWPDGAALPIRPPVAAEANSPR